MVVDRRAAELVEARDLGAGDDAERTGERKPLMQHWSSNNSPVLPESKAKAKAMGVECNSVPVQLRTSEPRTIVHTGHEAQ